MPHADVAGHSLHYARRGVGEPLLLLMGMSGSHLSWGEPFLDALGPGLDLIAYDHRGIGRSAPPDGPFSITDLAADAAGLLDALELDRAHVLGVSMGGMVAQELALADPERVRTLTLGCTFCGGPQARLTDPAVIQRLAMAIASGDRERAPARRLGRERLRGLRRAPGNYEAFHAMAAQLPAPVAVILAQMQAISGHDTSARLGAIRAPTLVIHGDRDQMLDVANGELIAGLIPGARLQVLPGVGHMFWWEQPERSAQLVRELTLAAEPAA